VSPKTPALEEEIGRLMREKHLTLCTVESATGGLISHRITNISGSSDYFKGSVASYSNEAKINIVGVKAGSIEKHGAVSFQVAKEMAAGGRKLFDADICVADTGIAGPTGDTPTKPVGLFYLGLSTKDGTLTRKHVFKGTRLQNKQQAAETALQWVMEYLLSSR
jgi:nicotinamide-nucleotide amidase